MIYVLLAFAGVLFVIYIVLCAASSKDDPAAEDRQQLAFLREICQQKRKRK